MGAKPRSSTGGSHLLGRTAIAVLGVVLVTWVMPLFHLVRVPGALEGEKSAAPADLPGIADKFWRERLQPSAAQAPDAATVLAALRADFPTARKRYARQVGLGELAYLYVSGEGRVIRKDGDQLLVALGSGEAGQPIVALETGPVFGNTVRDGSGLLDVNDFPSLEEYNALAAELDRLVEVRVLPALRERAQVGARIAFAGCAEAPESGSDSTPLAIVPVRAEIR